MKSTPTLRWLSQIPNKHVCCQTKISLRNTSTIDNSDEVIFVSVFSPYKYSHKGRWNRSAWIHLADATLLVIACLLSHPVTHANFNNQPLLCIWGNVHIITCQVKPDGTPFWFKIVIICQWSCDWIGWDRWAKIQSGSVLHTCSRLIYMNQRSNQSEVIHRRRFWSTWRISLVNV